MVGREQHPHLWLQMGIAQSHLVEFIHQNEAKHCEYPM